MADPTKEDLFNAALKRVQAEGFPTIEAALDELFAFRLWEPTLETDDRSID